MQFVADNWIWIVVALGLLVELTTGVALQRYGIGPLIPVRSFWLWFAIMVLFAASVGIAAYFSVIGR